MIYKSMPVSSKNLSRLPLFLLAIAEGVALFMAMQIARVALASPRVLPTQGFRFAVGDAAIVSVVMLLSLIAMGLYHFHQRIYFREVLARIIVGIVIGLLVVELLYLVVPSFSLDRKVTLLFLIIALAFLIAIRIRFVRYFDENVFQRRTIVLGAGDRSLPISKLRRRADRRGFKVVAKIPAPGDRRKIPCKYLLETDKTLPEIVLDTGAEEIIIAMDDRRGTLPIRQLLDCKLMGISVISLLEFLERETGKIRIDLVEPGWLILAPGFRTSMVRRCFKRSLDIVVASLATVLLFPVMITIAAMIKITEGLHAPVFYQQLRVGYRGAEFQMLKFRSMCVDAEADGKPRWAEIDDDRITRVGAVLRKFRLDELPQLLNVLKGEMSLVGPRPERPAFVAELIEELPYYAERMSAKPGLTGWAQLKYSYASTTDDALEKLQYDLWYVKNHNMLLDISVLLQTVEVILWGKGAR